MHEHHNWCGNIQWAKLVKALTRSIHLIIRRIEITIVKEKPAHLLEIKYLLSGSCPIPDLNIADITYIE